MLSSLWGAAVPAVLVALHALSASSGESARSATYFPFSAASEAATVVPITARAGEAPSPGADLAPAASVSGGASASLSPAAVPPAAVGTAGGMPAWARNQPLYEINVQTFTQAGSFKELQKHMPRLKALGVGILWLMPITTRGVERAFGSPYSVKDYLGFHAPYGQPQDFKDLVAEAHRHGLRIILDWVPNHSSWDNSLTREHKDYYKRDAAGNILQAYSWSDVAQLDYANPAMRAYMIGALKHWVTEYDVDGFRMDVAWGVPNDFWAEARASLDKVKPLYLLAEANHPNDQISFHSNYDWDLMGINDSPALLKVSNGSLTLAALDDLIQKDRRAYPAPFQRMRMTSNHDEWAHHGTPAQRLGNARKALAVLTATLPGKPLLWNGQEIDWNPGNRQAPIAWVENHEFTDFHGRLLRHYQSSPALHAGGFQRLRTSDDASIYAFARHQDRQRVAVFLNFTGQTKTVTFPAGESAAAYQDLFTGAPVNLPASATLTLPPWGYKVLTTEQGQTATLLRRPGQGNLSVTPLNALSPTGSIRLFGRKARGSGSEVFNALGIHLSGIPHLKP